MIFENGSRLNEQYWRLIKDGKRVLSSFDHRQQYGLPAPIDAISELPEHLQNKIVKDVCLRRGTGDLLFEFNNNSRLEIFGFTAYETWDISFPDGAKEYSNQVG